ncbi:response regulator transcription factor [Heyndrickxia acidicola]|uniref:Heme response regulator HssR n=1 Tax=Heyndrickxia acidicola TaxID=209389 RepID=A0ABU6MG48_9BACI|nr:response regulator transcription factor [Heyndrickxia acidicola]MED1203249.1 response regulator transcription factor [Heyndrickxia acidicola]
MATVLIVDDDPNIRELVRVFLAREGFSIVEAEDGKEALKVCEKERVDLLILDIMMPNMDGWEVCREIRSYYSDSLPILMLTAKGTTAEKLKGFEIGTDDYMVKPFEPEELIARVKALLKRYNISLSNKVSVGNVELDRSTLTVSDGKKEVTLPLKEFEILFKLGAHPGIIFTREQLIEEFWGYDYEGDERTVDVHIKRIRDRFFDEDCPFKITTIRGLGYRLERTR